MREQGDRLSESPQAVSSGEQSGKKGGAKKDIFCKVVDTCGPLSTVHHPSEPHRVGGCGWLTQGLCPCQQHTFI